MHLPAEKRKMPRMRVGFSARIFWGISNNRSDVNIQNLSIHGISFRSKKYFTQGVQFQLVIPGQGNESPGKQIRAEVVRCETLNGFSSYGKFKIGAKFLFKSHRPIVSKEIPFTEPLLHLQSNDSPTPFLDIDNGRLKSCWAQTYIEKTLSPFAGRIKIREVHAELIQSAREETVYTSIQIRQARFPSKGESFPETGDKPHLSNLALRKFSR